MLCNLKQEGLIDSNDSLIIITASITCPAFLLLSVEQATPLPTFRHSLQIVEKNATSSKSQLGT